MIRRAAEMVSKRILYRAFISGPLPTLASPRASSNYYIQLTLYRFYKQNIITESENVSVKKAKQKNRLIENNNN